MFYTGGGNYIHIKDDANRLTGRGLRTYCGRRSLPRELFLSRVNTYFQPIFPLKADLQLSGALETSGGVINASRV